MRAPRGARRVAAHGCSRVAMGLNGSTRCAPVGAPPRDTRADAGIVSTPAERPFFPGAKREARGDRPAPGSCRDELA